MKIIIVGGTGTIGKAVAEELVKQHEVVIVGKTSGEIQVDITDAHSIEKMYQSVKNFDAVVATTGNVHFAPFKEMRDADYQIGLQSKLMGQVNLVLIGLKYINHPGSFTLTSGILSRVPIMSGSSASMVNGALESFVMGAALEMPHDIRINIVSPTVLKESLDQYADYFPGFKSVAAHTVALFYRKSVEGTQSGEIYRVE